MYNYLQEKVFKNNELVKIEKSDVRSPEKPHTHDFIEIVYILSGNGIQLVDNKEYEVSRGSLMFINYGQTHAFSTKNKMSYCNILIKPEAVSEKIINTDNAFEILSLTAFEDFRTADTSCPFVRFEGEELIKAEAIINEMHYEYEKNLCGYNTVIKGYLLILLSYIFRIMVPGNNSFDTITGKITEYIEEHFNEKLSLEMLAKKCFYTPKYFSHVFKQCYNTTVTDYIQKKRLKEGCRLLLETNLSIDEISRTVGYDDDGSFYKYFRKMYNLTPNEYRSKKRNLNTL